MKRGTGKSGSIYIDTPGQEILERTSVIITDRHVEARFKVGLPAAGRRILGREARRIFWDDIPAIVERSLLYRNNDAEAIRRYTETNEDADHLRAMLTKLGLVAFVSDGSVLPRRSGIDDRPLECGTVIHFESPPSLRQQIELPNRGAITGMAIPDGVTLIVGGGFHGKSTLLGAIERGIYNHKPGDGREYVVSLPTAVKIRAEDGRRVEGVDISPFIENLPFDQETEFFSTDNASGSTSQAANIMEALELRAGLILIDEDTAATNFMIRDNRMQELIAKEKEPITPFIDRVRQLQVEQGVSTILVIGGSGDYFDVADIVIAMEDYRPQDVSDRAREVAERHRAERRNEGTGRLGSIRSRIPVPSSIDPSRGKRQVKITCHGRNRIGFGTETIDLKAIEQLVDTSQTRAIGDAINYARKHYIDGERTLAEIVDCVTSDIRKRGLGILSQFPTGDYAAFRSLELTAAINRLRSLRIKKR